MRSFGRDDRPRPAEVGTYSVDTVLSAAALPAAASTECKASEVSAFFTSRHRADPSSAPEFSSKIQFCTNVRTSGGHEHLGRNFRLQLSRVERELLSGKVPHGEDAPVLRGALPDCRDQLHFLPD